MSYAYCPVIDDPRLDRQRDRVSSVLLDSEGWLTLAEIQDAIRERFGQRDPESSISARIRDLRNKHGYQIEKRRRGAPERGCVEYMIVDQEAVA